MVIQSSPILSRFESAKYLKQISSSKEVALYSFLDMVYVAFPSEAAEGSTTDLGSIYIASASLTPRRGTAPANTITFSLFLCGAIAAMVMFVIIVMQRFFPGKHMRILDAINKDTLLSLFNMELLPQ